MIPAATLANLQAIAARVLDQTCQIQRAVNTPDGYGSASQSWPVVATVLAFLQKPTGAYIQDIAARLGELASWQVVLPPTTDVRVADRLVIGALTLTVQAVYGPTSNEILRSALASEVR